MCWNEFPKHPWFSDLHTLSNEEITTLCSWLLQD